MTRSTSTPTSTAKIVLQGCAEATTVFQVVLVDYGRRVVVSTEAVRPMDESLLEIPVQVFVCNLAGLETPNWTPEGLQYFRGE